MNFKNMKIKVENNLDEIVAELERLGYKPHWFGGEPHVNFIATKKQKYTDFANEGYCDFYCGVSYLTTLAELKEMK